MREVSVTARSWRRRGGALEDAGRSACRALARDDNADVRRTPQLLVRRRRRVAAGAGQRQRDAAAASPAQHADGVPSLAALVQSHHARRRRTASGLHVRREHAAPAASPELLQSALPRRPPPRPRLLQRSVRRRQTPAVAASTSQRVDEDRGRRVDRRRRRRRRLEAPSATATATAPSTAVAVTDVTTMPRDWRPLRQLNATRPMLQSQPQRLTARRPTAGHVPRRSAGDAVTTLVVVVVVVIVSVATDDDAYVRTSATAAAAAAVAAAAGTAASDEDAALNVDQQ